MAARIAGHSPVCGARLEKEVNLMALHFLLDASLPLLTLMVSQGMSITP